MAVANLVSVNGSKISSVPKIVDIKPLGSSVLVELLTEQELTSSTIFVEKKTNVGDVPQAYVLAIGSGLKEEDLPFGVGSRVVVSGTGTWVPKFDENPRTRLFLEVHNIKGVIVEEGKTCSKPQCCRA